VASQCGAASQNPATIPDTSSENGSQVGVVELTLERVYEEVLGRHRIVVRWLRIGVHHFISKYGETPLHCSSDCIKLNYVF